MTTAHINICFNLDQDIALQLHRFDGLIAGLEAREISISTANKSVNNSFTKGPIELEYLARTGKKFLRLKGVEDREAVCQKLLDSEFGVDISDGSDTVSNPPSETHESADDDKDLI